MDLIRITDSPAVLDGLRMMLDATLGKGAGDGYLPCATVEAPTALLVLAIARLADDDDQRKDGEEWFPRGKWATIQALESRVERELSRLFAG